MNEEPKKQKQVVYGFSDLIIGPEHTPPKYIQIHDANGTLLGEVEVYLIGYEDVNN